MRSGTATTRRVRLVIVLAVAAAVTVMIGAILVAVGPVMQALRRPVNDLSRGATIKDIVNTVAITAIQAQGFLSHP